MQVFHIIIEDPTAGGVVGHWPVLPVVAERDVLRVLVSVVALFAVVQLAGVLREGLQGVRGLRTGTAATRSHIHFHRTLSFLCAPGGAADFAG